LKTINRRAFLAESFPETRLEALGFSYNGGRAMDARYKGHHIRFAAIPVSNKSAWTFFAIVVGETGSKKTVNTFTLDWQEFACREEATRQGLEFVKNWIKENRPDMPLIS
jgi:hypothetical protein